VSFEFGTPWLLAALLLALPMGWWLLRRRPVARVRFSSLRNLKSIRRSPMNQLRHCVPLLRLLAFVAIVLALARPRYGRHSVEVTSDGVDIVMAIDTSGSMRALDFHPTPGGGSERQQLRKLALDRNAQTRLDVVKEVVRDFIAGREADRLGMVVFGEDAYTQCPMTLDHGILLSFLDEVEIGMAGGNSTAIGSALATGVARLKDLQSKSKVVILLTDGRNNAGKIAPATAAELAAKYSIKVYTIGVGSRGTAWMREDNPIFGPRLVPQPEVDIDEDLLREIAAKTGGRFFRAHHKQELRQIYDTIDKLEKTEIKVKEHVEYNEIYASFVLIGLGLLLLEILLAGTRFKTLP
jgi:Ca-activated chloride channel family protein